MRIKFQYIKCSQAVCDFFMKSQSALLFNKHFLFSPTAKYEPQLSRLIRWKNFSRAVQCLLRHRRRGNITFVEGKP